MDSKLNILFISSWFPTKDKPTLGNFVVSHAKSVSLLHSVDIIHVAKASDLHSRFQLEQKKEGDLNISLMYFQEAQSGFSFLNKIINIIRQFRAYQKLYHLLEDKPRLVHVNVVFPVGFIALWIKLRYRIPYVITEHWTIYQPENRYLLKGIKGFAFQLITKKSSRIMPVSYQLKEMMIDSGMRGKYTVVPNTIDISVFKYNEKPDTDMFKFIHISTLIDEHKNASGILRTFKKLIEIDASNHLTIVSDGDVDFFSNYAQEIGISDHHIKFIGTLSSQQIAKHFHQSHAFVLFSNYENLPVVILEAFATGTPVISSDVGGIKRFFSEEYGYLIPKQDEEVLLKAMIDIKKNYQNIPFKSLSEYAQLNFSHHSVAQAYSAIYYEILNR